LDFTKNVKTVEFSGRTIGQNSKDTNDLEKSIKDLLKKNKYDTDENILEQENKKLFAVNPEELKKRYEELKKMKNLLFQQERSNKRKSKIKSKLYHKIKKKQKDREENDILAQLQEIDPEGVKKYLESKKLNRIKERITQKHSFNSKFNKTIKRYNLQNDQNVKEAIKENLKLRDELLRKIKGNDEEEDDENVDDIFGSEDNSNYDEDEAEDQDDKDNESDLDLDENAHKNDKPDVELDKLLIDFNEKKEVKKNKKENNGVWGMKFMQKNAVDPLQSELKDVYGKYKDGGDDEMDIVEEDYESDNLKKQLNKENSKHGNKTNANNMTAGKGKLNARIKNELTEEDKLNVPAKKTNKINSEVNIILFY
jgi:U3 small nucleolar RNA-associated protein 14